MNRKYFGTDGVRGPYGGPLINEAFAARLGCAAARSVGRGGRVLIGRDTRGSGAALEAAVARGLRAGGLDPVSLGIVPTPAVALAVRAHQDPLGVVITASHNPAEDNGIKFFGPGGLKLTDEQEARIETLLPERVDDQARPLDAIDARGSYLAAAQRLLPAEALRGWRIVLDTANGATATTSPDVLRALGAEVIGIGDRPDGRNINDGVGSEHPARLAAETKARGARLGVAHDGDGDRCVVCDELGQVLDGDEILTILATHALERGALANRILVTTVQSNLGVDAAIRAAGGRVVRTAVGDRYVIEGMLKEQANLGGESSGHIICSEISPTGDGLAAALKVIEVMLASGQPLSQLRSRLRKFPQLTAALKVAEKKPLESLPGLGAAIRALEAELGERGRVLVRYSGTEAKLRLLVEGPSDDVVRDGLNRLDAAVRAELRVL
ncbi:MAG: phosphoglucosamine mutase [Verrucomicrobia bacterium]|nr:phosphoglucosamine mutase [Verrucomicrobiota bacterium]